MQEFVTWAKGSPGKLNYASPGIGSVHHLATEMLTRAAGLELVHVPYRTGLYAPLLAGEVQAMFDSLPGPLALPGERETARARGHRAQAPGSAARRSHAGRARRLAGVDANSWWGFVGPAGLPSAVVARLNTETRLILDEPEMKSLLAGWGIEARPVHPRPSAAAIAEESARWKATGAAARSAAGVKQSG